MKKEKSNRETADSFAESSVENENATEATEPMSEKERVKKEKAEWKYRRKVKRGFKALRLRKLKNFLFWLTGVVSGLVILATTVFVAVGVVPVKTFFGNNADETVSPELSDKSLLGIIMNIGDYTQSYSSVTQAFPIVEKSFQDILSKVGEYVEFDLDSIKDVPFTDSEFTTKLYKSMKITATLQSIGADSLLNGFAELSIFKDEAAISAESGEQYTVKTIDDSVEGFKYRLYSYKDTESGEYLSAANADSTGWSDAIQDTDTPLYYASLLTMNFSDLTEVVIDRLTVVKIVDLIETFSEGTKDGVIGKVLGDLDIGGIAKFDPTSIKVSAFIPRFETDENGNETETETDTYGMLRELLNVPEDEEILVSHLTGMDIDNVKVSAFIPRFETDENGNETETETDTYGMLRELLDVSDGEEILVSDLKNMDGDKIKISSLISEGSDFVDILKCGLGKGENDEIFVSELGNFDPSKVKLSLVADRDTYASLYEILDEIVSPSGENNEILISDLIGIDIHKLKISSIMNEKGDLYKIIKDSVKAEDDDTPVLIDDLRYFDIKNVKIKLEDVMDRYEIVDGKQVETQLFRILNSTVTGTGEDGAIMLSDLKSFSLDNLPITELINTDSKFYSVLSETVSGSGDNGAILAGDIKNNFDMGKLRLSTVIDSDSEDVKNNKILSALLKDGEVTVGNLSNKINELELSQVFEVECFTADSANAVTYTNTDFGKYRKVKGVGGEEYFLLSSVSLSVGEDYVDETYYYVSKTSQSWLFMYYNTDNDGNGSVDTADFDQNGFAKSYKSVNLAFGNMQDAVGQMSERIKGASVRQLVSAGLMNPNDGYEDNGFTYIYAKSINEALGA